MNKKACDIIIFGGHGDLALRKLMPALYHLCQDEHLDNKSKIIAVSREKLTTEEYCEVISKKFQESFKDDSYKQEMFDRFISHLEYISVDLMNESDYNQPYYKHLLIY